MPSPLVAAFLLGLQPPVSLPRAAPDSAAPPAASAVSSTFSGRDGQLDVYLPQLAGELPRVDGQLTERQWASASLLTGFTTYHPVDGRPAADSTEVRLWYAEEALFVAVRAWAAPGTVRATLAERDRIANDDWVAIHLDTFDDRRRAFVFAVNPLGVQTDGVRTEQSAGPGASRAALATVDLSQDYVWQSAGRLLDDGYVVEVRIPFKSLRFQAGARQDWGVQVVRQVQRTGYQDTWAPTSKARQSFAAQAGRLRGLQRLRRGLVLDVTPTTTGFASGAPAGPDWRYAGRGEVGGDVRWGLTPNFTLGATANPDFSQVETDVGQIPGDVRFALFFPELRPFFVEGSEQFDAPNQLVYTRRIVQPVVAAKLTGKVPRTDIGFLGAIDEAGASADGRTHPRFTVLRVRRDVGAQSIAGLVLTDRTEGTRFNRVGGGDVRLQFRDVYSAEVRAVGSVTRDGAGTRTGHILEAATNRSGRSYGYRYAVSAFSPDFATEAGFVNRTDFARVQLFQRYTRFGRPGGWWDSQQHFLRTEALWTHAGVGERQAPLEATATLENTFTLRGGWRVVLSPQLQGVAFDPRRYATRLVAAPAGGDPAPFVPLGRQGTAQLQLQVTTPQWRRAGATLAARHGTDPEFLEAATARRSDADLAVDLRPSPQLRVGALLRWQRFVRSRDGSVLSTQVVPRLRTEYQFSRALFARLIVQVESRERDALRDPRSDAPLLERTRGGAVVPLAATRSLRGRADALLSYLPNPGTVVYLGYGSALDATPTMRPLEAARTSDGWFVKLSYLFRAGGTGGNGR